MALPVITARATVFNTAAASSYATTQTYTPAADALLIACVVNSLASTPLDPTTFTGHGVTWTKLTLGTRTIGTTHCLSVWVAKAGKAPTSAAATAGFNAVSQTGCAIIEYEVNGADVSGTAAQAIQQNPTGTATTGTTGTVTYAGRTAAANAQLSFFAHLANEATTPRTNWTEDTTVASDGSYNTPAVGLEGQYRNDGTFETSSTATWATTINWLAVGLEIIAALVPQSCRPAEIAKPLARPSALLSVLTLGLSLLQSTLAPTTPFSQADWPIPGRAGSILIGTSTRPADDAAAVAAPFNQGDWPNPLIARPSPPTARSWTFGYPDTAGTPLLPIDAPLPRRAAPRLAAETPPNLLETTLAAAAPVAAPFGPLEWPIPARKPAAFETRTGVGGLLQSTLQPAIPAQADWPLPRAIPRLNGLSTQASGMPAALVGQDTFFAGPGCGPDYDYPNPQGKPYPVSLRTWTVDGRQLELDVDAPAFRQTDWPIPARVQPARELRTWAANALECVLAPAIPGQTDWPLPRRASALASLPTWLQPGLALQTGLSAPPFVPVAFDLPRGTNASLALRTWLETRKAYYVDLTPAHLTEWPIVRAARRPVDGFAQNGILSAPVVTAAPFSASDWPLPLRGARPSVAFGQAGILAAAAPLRPVEWPLPLRAKRIDLTWTLSLPSAALLPPFAQADWPLPSSKPAAISLRTVAESRKPFLVDQTPASLTDWPNPRGPAYPLALRTALDNRLASTLAPQPPIALNDWPVPLAIPRAAVLRTHLQPVTLTLLGQDAFFGVGGPAYDWPNPRGPVPALALRSWLQTIRDPSGFIARNGISIVATITATDVLRTISVDVQPAHTISAVDVARSIEATDTARTISATDTARTITPDL